ncbi:MAG: transposase [Candidatus Bathyarchaeia archaeon]|nr:transposase [Candidatus Bathyarchaeia archaeon]
MDGFQRLPLDTLKYLFSKIDISITVSGIESVYANSGRGRPRYPVRSMLLALLFMRFEAIPSIRKLCRRLERRSYAREICEFNGDRTPRHNTFSLFIKRAKPKTIEELFKELRDQAFAMGVIDPEETIKVSVDSTFMKAYSRRGRKGGISDRGARVGKTERRSYKLGWRSHTVASMSALPITYIVRAANVNDKEVVKPLLKQASRLLKRYKKRISHVIADSQYYSAEVFKTIRGYVAEPVIPHPINVKEPLINLYVTKRFRVKGDPKLVELYKLKMAVERAFKAGKHELMMENLRWRGVAKVRMHVAICYACIYAVAITAHKIGRPDLANSIATFTY